MSDETTNEWRAGKKPALLAAAALRDWIARVADEEWRDMANPPEGWDWNDSWVIEIAIKELERLSGAGQ